MLTLGVTHLPEVQCIDILSILSSLNARNAKEDKAEHKSVPTSSSGSATDDGDGSSVDGSGNGMASNAVSDAPQAAAVNHSIPMVCLVLATDGVWYVTFSFCSSVFLSSFLFIFDPICHLISIPIQSNSIQFKFSDKLMPSALCCTVSSVI